MAFSSSDSETASVVPFVHLEEADGESVVAVADATARDIPESDMKGATSTAGSWLGTLVFRFVLSSERKRKNH